MSNCKCNAANAAIITPVLAAGSTDSPYYWQVNITQQLCASCCADRVPMFAPTFSLVSYSAVGVGQYVATIAVQGLVSFVPCGSTECCTRCQIISQTFALPFASDTAPTSVAVSGGTTVNAVATAPCKSCGRTFVSETPLTLTIA